MSIVLPNLGNLLSERINADLTRDLAVRSAMLRVQSTEIVGPLISRSENYTRQLLELFRRAMPPLRTDIGRLASEAAWLTANAHSDNASDHQAVRWAKLGAKIAREIGDEDLRAHSMSRISRSHLSLDRPGAALAVLDAVDHNSLSAYGAARIEVHRALAIARSSSGSDADVFLALDRARRSLLYTAPRTVPRPEWVWWTDDEGFILSWEAEALRSLHMPQVAEPVFRHAIRAAAAEDSRERPFLQVGLAEIVEQRGDIEESANEAIRAVVLARAVSAEAALGRIWRLYSRLATRAGGNSQVRVLGEILRTS